MMNHIKDKSSHVKGDNILKVHLKPKMFSGAISLSDIPLNWSQKRETASILEIVNICYGPYGPNNKPA
jgi:hypothetical protein